MTCGDLSASSETAAYGTRPLDNESRDPRKDEDDEHPRTANEHRAT